MQRTLQSSSCAPFDCTASATGLPRGARQNVAGGGRDGERLPGGGGAEERQVSVFQGIGGVAPWVFEKFPNALGRAVPMYLGTIYPTLPGTLPGTW